MTFGWSVWNNSWLIPGWFGAEDHGFYRIGWTSTLMATARHPRQSTLALTVADRQYAAVARPLDCLPRPTRPQRLLTSDLHRGTRARRCSLSARKADYPQTLPSSAVLVICRQKAPSR